MKRILSLVLISSMVLFGTQCSEDQDVSPSNSENKPYNVVFKFSVDDKMKDVKASFIFDELQQRYVIKSGEIIEIKAIHEITRKTMYVYTMKQYDLPKSNYRVEWSIKTGYYGYDAGCFYWGTLFTDNNGNEIFSQSRSNYNPPICPGGEWAYVAPSKPKTRGFDSPASVNKNLLLPYL